MHLGFSAQIIYRPCGIVVFLGRMANTGHAGLEVEYFFFFIPMTRLRQSTEAPYM